MIWLSPYPGLDQLDTCFVVFVAVMFAWIQDVGDGVVVGVVGGGSGVWGRRSGVGEGAGVSLVSSSPMLKTGVPLGSFRRPSTR